jgi:hypothetical protein
MFFWIKNALKDMHMDLKREFQKKCGGNWDSFSHLLYIILIISNTSGEIAENKYYARMVKTNGALI